MPEKTSAFSQIIGRSRFIVLIAVVAVLLASVSLFLQGTIQALYTIYETWSHMFPLGQGEHTNLAVEFLEVVSTMLKAVVFYLIGVGLYSLFVSPLNLTSALGVESLADLETKVINVVVVILGVTFLEHFVRWEEPIATLYFGAAMAVVAFALVTFLRFGHKDGLDLMQPETRTRARREMFERGEDEKTITQQEVALAEETVRETAKARAGDGTH